jgi:quercetin dioxygenase-like cupin family protein
MRVIRAGEGRRRTEEGKAYEGLAVPSTGAQELVVARVRKELAAAIAAHSHDREEVVVVLGGRARAEVAGQTVELEAGDTLIIPAGALHEVSTLGDVPFDCLIAKPAGIRFFDPAGRPMAVPDHVPDLDQTLQGIRGLVAPGGRVVLVDNVAPHPALPHRWFVAEAVRMLAGDLLGRRRPVTEAVELFRLNIHPAWLDHLTSDRFLNPVQFHSTTAPCSPERAPPRSTAPAGCAGTPHPLGRPAE